MLRGPSGSGKSDLALRLIATGARLVADDQTELVRKGKVLIARAPDRLAGLIEARGVGIVKLGRDQVVMRAPVALLVDLASPERIERLPEPAHECVLGLRLPLLTLAPFEASASAKLHLALRQTTVA
jgi:serine kinase of HPr protein (carbohydrate metabolism regulator)